MNKTDVDAPKPGTSADFKQRREAHGMYDRLVDAGGTAARLLAQGKGKEALEAMAPTMKALEQNPRAEALVERQSATVLRLVRDTHEAAKAAAERDRSPSRDGDRSQARAPEAPRARSQGHERER